MDRAARTVVNRMSAATELTLSELETGTELERRAWALLTFWYGLGRGLMAIRADEVRRAGSVPPSHRPPRGRG